MGVTSDRLVGLDALRGVAALTVVAYHASRSNPYGYLAVDLFFMLSGFVLVHAYGTRQHPVSFMVARMIRLWPMFAVGILVGLALRGGSLWALFFIPTFEGQNFYPMNPALWSVLLEVVASICFAFLARFGLKVWLPIFIFSLAALLPTLIATDGQSGGMGMPTIEIGLARLGVCFTIGIGLYSVFRRIRYRSSTPWIWVAIASFVVLTFAPPSSAILPLAIFVVFPSLILLCAVVETPETRFAQWLGRISYPLYVIHHPLTMAAGWYLTPIMLPAAHLLDKHIDRPVRRWLTSLRKLERPADQVLMPK